MLDLAPAHARSESIANVDFLVADAERLPRLANWGAFEESSAFRPLREVCRKNFARFYELAAPPYFDELPEAETIAARAEVLETLARLSSDGVLRVVASIVVAGGRR